MGLHHSPRIVTSGLVLALDAADRNSYPGTGATWLDLSGNNNSGSLTAGPTFNGANGGSIQFDGTDDYIDNVGGLSSFNFIQNTNVFSINIWFKINDLTNSQIIMGNSITAIEKGFYVQFLRGYTSTFGEYNISCLVTNGINNNLVSVGATDNNTVTSTNWINACYVINNATSGQWYFNGVAVTTSIKKDTQTVTNSKSTGNSTRTLNIARGNYSSTLATLKGNISNVQLYNRALSATEVLQNYNATKSRFGLK